MSPGPVYVRDGEVLSVAPKPGEIMMMSVATDRYYAVTDVAARIWELLEWPSSLDLLCGAIRSEFEVDDAACRRAIETFVGELMQDGLARIVS